MTTRIVLGLGSNVGDRENYLNQAVKKLILELQLTNLKRSKILENPALLLPDSPKEWNRNFFNIAVSADIDLNDFPIIKILEIIKKIETEIGRINRGRWAPREIDIDILAVGELFIDLGETLQIPHPGLFNRDFFAITFLEIEPEMWQFYKENFSANDSES